MCLLRKMPAGNRRAQARLRAARGQAPPFPKRAGQASLETTVAIIGALLLLFGSLKVFIWINQRILARYQAYESSRVAAGSSAPGQRWGEPAQRLEIFK